MRISSVSSHLALGVASLSGALAASYDDIPDIQVYGQHFFYTNNGSQFYMKGVAYQENFDPNGTTDANTQYTDPLANGDKCRRDIPFMKQIFTNIIRVYAIDPTANHDDCMEQLAANDIYVIADLSEPTISITNNDPAWNVDLFVRYASVVDSLQKYKNVLGFFAGNEVVSRDNETAAAAFVKAAVRDTKGYIKSQNYRNTLGVGYATADVPSRDGLAQYFACEPEDGASTTIDFWGYNVYSWCGFSSYQESSYGERVDFFSDYPVPVFFAEYGCNEGLDDLGGPDHRPFTEVEVIYGNMTEVFSGGIVYQWFWTQNMFGLVEIDGDTVNPKPDFTSLQSQLAAVTPTITASSAYRPSNSPPACPTTDASWAAVASPLPPPVNRQLCSCEASAVTCNVASDDPETYGDAFGFICGEQDGKYCAGIARNATTGEYGALSGCSPKDQLAWVANQFYNDQSNKASACDFNGVAATQSPQTDGQCSSLIAAVGTDGLGTVPSPTGQQGNTAATSSDNAAAGLMSAPAIFGYGKAFFVAYAVIALVSGIGMFVL